MTNRFESISGILGRATGQTDRDPASQLTAVGDRAAVAPPHAVQGPVRAAITRPAGTSTSSGTAARRGTATPAQPKSAEADGGVRRIAFRLNPDLYAALAEQATRGGTSHGQIVLDSVETAHTAGVLADLIARQAEPDDPGALFPRLKTRGPSRPTIPVEIRLHTRAAAILDTLVQQTNADSRTQLITAALHHHLA